MPRTLSTSEMVTPGSPGPPFTEPTEDEQAGQPLLDGAPSSASLDTLIQHLVPTADYYPEVGGSPSEGVEGEQNKLSPLGIGETTGLELALGLVGGGWEACPLHALVSFYHLSPVFPRKPTSSPSC